MSGETKWYRGPLEQLVFVYVALLAGIWIGVFISNIHDPLGTLLFYRAALVGFLIFTPSMFLIVFIEVVLGKLLTQPAKREKIFQVLINIIGLFGAVCLGCLLAFGLIELIIRTTISFIAGLF